MKASDLIAALQGMVDAYGDLPVLGGTVIDDSSEITVLCLGEDDQEIGLSESKPAGFFLEAK